MVIGNLVISNGISVIGNGKLVIGNGNSGNW